MTYLLIFCAGGVGASLRFVLDSWFKNRYPGRIPLGIFLINVTGSLLLGILTGLLLQASGPASMENLGLVLGAGLLGGYTTFSTALLEAVAQPGKTETLILLLVQPLCAILAAAIGLTLGGIAL